MRARILIVLLLAACEAHTGPLLLPFELEAANDAKQPLVIELGASWCKPCQYFSANILPDPRVQAALQGIHFVRYDIDTHAGADAQARVGSHGVPSVAGFDRDGRVKVFKQGTEGSVDNFLEFLREVHVVLDQK
jgi:thiol:disulfide interchange protein